MSEQVVVPGHITADGVIKLIPLWEWSSKIEVENHRLCHLVKDMISFFERDVREGRIVYSGEGGPEYALAFWRRRLSEIIDVGRQEGS